MHLSLRGGLMRQLLTSTSVTSANCGERVQFPAYSSLNYRTTPPQWMPVKSSRKKEDLFREKAVQRLSSPEQLDLLMKVTSPLTWCTVTTCGLLISAALLWGIFGTLPEQISGDGILLRGGALLQIEAGTSGRIVDVLVEKGALVRRNDLVASINQKGLDLQISLRRKSIENKTQKHRDLQQLEGENVTRRTSALKQEFSDEEKRIVNHESRLSAARARVKSDREGYKRGLITRRILQATEDDFRQAESMLLQSKTRLRQIEADLASLVETMEKNSTARLSEIAKLKQELEVLEVDKEKLSNILSPYEGRVVEVKLIKGQLVQASQAVCSVEILNQDVEAVVYVPAREGKKIQVGMDVNISPSTIKREEFGYIRGRVGAVSSFPATAAGMKSVLGNDQLVREFSQLGAPIEVVTLLEQDDSTPSGYKWSSSNGPDAEIFPGTTCNASIVVKRKRPISYVIPIIRESVGL